MFLLLFVGEFHRLNPPRPTTPPIEDSNMLQVDSLKGDVPELCVNEGSLPLDRLLCDVCVCVCGQWMLGGEVKGSYAHERRS